MEAEPVGRERRTRKQASRGRKTALADAASEKPLLEVVYRPIEQLIPYARNSRVHGHEQITKLAALMREFGWTNPVLTDGERGIVAGHGRVLAARLLWDNGGEIRHTPAPGMVPTIEISGWSEPQKRAYIIADNASALMARWDDELRALELAELREAGFDLTLTAIDDAEIARLLAAVDAADPGALNPPPEDFSGYGEDIETTHQCPKCGYRWSGSSAPTGESDDAPAKDDENEGHA